MRSFHEPGEPECGTEDVEAEAEIVLGLEGTRCSPGSADADLRVTTTLTTQWCPVEWQISTTCLVGAVRVTRVFDGQVFALESRPCGSARTEWSVSPDEPQAGDQSPLASVFDLASTPPGTYATEVEFLVNIAIAPAMFEVAIGSP